MNKTLASLAALALCSGAAHAQTNVTIYGVADAGIAIVDDGRDTNYKLDSGNQSGSRLGFRGTEDLGGGLSAIFTLESGFSLDNGQSGQGDRLFGRQAFVGLKGGFGTVKLGRQYNPIRLAVESTDPFGHGLAGNAANVFNVHGERADNTLNYTSPTVSGFTGQLAYSFGEVADSTSTGRQLGASLGYKAGPLQLVFAYHDQNLADAGLPDGEENTAFLGATYDFGMVKLHGAYSQSEGESAAGVNTFDRDDVMIGVSVPLGNGTLLASYIDRSEDIGANRDANQTAIGYVYPLSKRTNFYTSYQRTSNKSGADLNDAAALGEDPSLFNIGIRHRF